MLEDDKTFNRSGALTVGRNINETSSLFFNLSLDIKQNENKVTGDSDIISSSISYFKIFGIIIFLHMHFGADPIIENKKIMKQKDME